ncbi:MAG: rhodanese-related sulfurtransferase [Richelia sp. SL_2_1]|nr:rhodanese-related sulfurtransferase [Richelia sp. SM1_7_0]NJN09805.1 rhodanese-related sulfurtransferase [Richelia sp. RM1_1_1]NJO29479.1 rhodanese-related sulfurtransferase [Richelia sp. SL_2_1]
MSVIVATLYKFVQLPDYVEKQQSLLSICQSQEIKGTILLAQEGINGTIAGSRQGIDTVMDFLRSDSRLTDLEYKESTAESPPFQRLKVKLKNEIVTLGLPEINPSEQVGTYVNPQDWNQIISDPQVTVIDTRNDYEVSIGTFRRAENPQTESFREFPEYVEKNLNPEKNKKVAMFCTGGIRCEKATSYLISQGFEQVYHLKGGILKYLEEVPKEQSLWEGECFVFDERIAVVHGLELGSYDMCLSCGHPISDIDKASSKYEEGISCPHCFDHLTEEKKAKMQEKKRQRFS